MKVSAYWTSNFFIDIIKYFISAILMLLVTLIMDATSLISGEKYGVLWVLFLLYGLAMAPFVYLTGFFFKSYSSA